ncbi:MAG TPA: nickel-binding protein [Polyangiaceae bacterium]|nr:nickel-binding protein [Polyangiaceae bacterium]
MRSIAMVLGGLALSAVACGKGATIRAATPASSGLASRESAPAEAAAEPLETPAAPSATPANRRLFLDVHEVGPGKITLEVAANAHQRDLATQAQYGVEFKTYWVDLARGKIYCLAEAPSMDAVNAVHREAHGLLADKIVEVTAAEQSWTTTPGTKLFIDHHAFGQGKVNAAAVAAAHAKDLATQSKHDVRYLNYWFDAANGTVTCLAEGPSADAVLAVHQESHGLMPDSIEEVVEGSAPPEHGRRH